MKRRQFFGAFSAFVAALGVQGLVPRRQIMVRVPLYLDCWFADVRRTSGVVVPYQSIDELHEHHSDAVLAKNDRRKSVRRGLIRRRPYSMVSEVAEC